jgi:hypothetical protein
LQISVKQIDEEIRATENRILLERAALDDAVHGCTNSLREAVASPKTLLAVMGVGFAVGKILFRGGSRNPPPVVVQPKAGMLGMLTGLAGTAMSLMQPNSSMGSLARWAVQRALTPGEPRRKPAPPAAAGVRPTPPTRTAPVAPAPPATLRADR